MFKKGIFSRKMLILALTLAVSLVFAACGNNAKNNDSAANTTQKSKTMDKEMEPYYVDSAWLKTNLSNVVILDARTEKEYKGGHIPGALNVTWQSLSNMQPKQGQAGWGVVLPMDKLSKRLGELGIDGTKTIIVYNDPKGLGEEGRVLWTLRLAGLQNSKMLNGGWPAWVANGGEKNKEVPTVKSVDFKITAPDNSLLTTTDYVKANLKNIKLVDTRSPEEFKGETNHGENVNGQKALGHIPGAIHIHYHDCYNDDGTIKSIADLKQMFEKAGLKPEDEIITYCTVGIRSGFTAEILRMCGYKNAKNYNGSFSEWAGAGLPFEK